jgi:hypothetical protein
MRMTTTQIFLARYLMSAGAAISLAPTVRSASRPSGEIHPGRTDRGFGRMRSVYVMRCWGLISAATLRLAPPLPPPIGLPAIQLVAVGTIIADRTLGGRRQSSTSGSHRTQRADFPH